MIVDALASSGQLVQLRFAEYRLAQAKVETYSQAESQWYASLDDKPRAVALFQRFFNIGRPSSRHVLDWKSTKMGVLDALKRQPGTYPLKTLTAFEDAYLKLHFHYGFNHEIDGEQFMVDYFPDRITAQIAPGQDPIIEVRGGGQDALLHLPGNFRIPVQREDYTVPQVYPEYLRHALWAPKLTDTPSIVTLPRDLLGRINWVKDLKGAHMYTATEAVLAA